MADELTVGTSWTYSKNGSTRSLPAESAQWDVSGSGKIENIQNIGFAAHEALILGEVATPGFAYFKNLDATNYVQIGVDVAAAFVPFVKLLPGQSAQVWLGTTAPYAKANTGAVLLDYMIADV